MTKMMSSLDPLSNSQLQQRKEERSTASHVRPVLSDEYEKNLFVTKMPESDLDRHRLVKTGFIWSTS